MNPSRGNRTRLRLPSTNKHAAPRSSDFVEAQQACLLVLSFLPQSSPALPAWLPRPQLTHQLIRNGLNNSKEMALTGTVKKDSRPVAKSLKLRKETQEFVLLLLWWVSLNLDWVNHHLLAGCLEITSGNGASNPRKAVE